MSRGIVLSLGLVGTAAGFAIAATLGGFEADEMQRLLSLCLTSQPAAVPERLWLSWSLAPAPVAALLALGLLGCTTPKDRSQTACFFAGWSLLAVALVSPLCRLAATTASGHMLQHVILIALSPPLLVAAGIGDAAEHLRHRFERWPRTAWAIHRTDRLLAMPLAAGALYGLAVWLAHAPVIYEAALRDPVMHLLLIGLLVLVSLVFWHAVLRAPPFVGFFLAFVTMIHTGLLGALLALAPSPWYSAFADRVWAWGLTPLEDQQIAGLIMWVPMAGLYFAAGLWSLSRLLSETPRQA